MRVFDESNPWQDDKTFTTAGFAQSLIETHKLSVRWIALTPYHGRR